MIFECVLTFFSFDRSISLRSIRSVLKGNLTGKVMSSVFFSSPVKSPVNCDVPFKIEFPSFSFALSSFSIWSGFLANSFSFETDSLSAFFASSSCAPTFTSSFVTLGKSSLISETVSLFCTFIAASSTCFTSVWPDFSNIFGDSLVLISFDSSLPLSFRYFSCCCSMYSRCCCSRLSPNVHWVCLSRLFGWALSRSSAIISGSVFVPCSMRGECWAAVRFGKLVNVLWLKVFMQTGWCGCWWKTEAQTSWAHLMQQWFRDSGRSNWRLLPNLLHVWQSLPLHSISCFPDLHLRLQSHISLSLLFGDCSLSFSSFPLLIIRFFFCCLLVELLVPFACNFRSLSLTNTLASWFGIRSVWHCFDSMLGWMIGFDLLIFLPAASFCDVCWPLVDGISLLSGCRADWLSRWAQILVRMWSINLESISVFTDLGCCCATKLISRMLGAVEVVAGVCCKFNRSLRSLRSLLMSLRLLFRLFLSLSRKLLFKLLNLESLRGLNLNSLALPILDRSFFVGLSFLVLLLRPSLTRLESLFSRNFSKLLLRFVGQAEPREAAKLETEDDRSLLFRTVAAWSTGCPPALLFADNNWLSLVDLFKLALPFNGMGGFVLESGHSTDVAGSHAAEFIVLLPLASLWLTLSELAFTLVFDLARCLWSIGWVSLWFLLDCFSPLLGGALSIGALLNSIVANLWASPAGVVTAGSVRVCTSNEAAPVSNSSLLFALFRAALVTTDALLSEYCTGGSTCLPLSAWSLAIVANFESRSVRGCWNAFEALFRSPFRLLAKLFRLFELFRLIFGLFWPFSGVELL